MIREFYQPDTLIKALQIRSEKERSSLLAGGTDFVVAMHQGKIPEGSVIDLSKVKELKGITIESDRIRIRSMTSFTEIADSELLNDAIAILCEAARTIGSPQIRNRATIGGNICNASAAADSVAPLLCLDAEVELSSLGADQILYTRIMPLEEFLVDSKKTALKSNEIMTAILLRSIDADEVSSFQKIGRRNALAIARINGSCVLSMQKNVVKGIHFALGASTSKPERIKVVEEMLIGRELTDKTLNDAGKRAAEYVRQQTGVRSSSDYKHPVIEKFTISLINAAFEKER